MSNEEHGESGCEYILGLCGVPGHRGMSYALGEQLDWALLSVEEVDVSENACGNTIVLVFSNYKSYLLSGTWLCSLR